MTFSLLQGGILILSNPKQVLSHQSSGGWFERTHGPRNDGRVVLNHLHLHQLGSLLLPILRSLSRDLHRHPSATHDHIFAPFI